MFKILLALHLLFVVLAVGPLVHAATTAARGLRTRDGAAIASSARMLRIYSYVSVLVVILGFGLASAKSPYTHKTVAEFGDTWIWLSGLLWLVAVVLVLAVMIPALHKAADLAEEQPVGSLAARVAACGGTVGVIFAAIVFLMVYQPGA